MRASIALVPFLALGCVADGPESVVELGRSSEDLLLPDAIAAEPIGRFAHGEFDADGGVAEIVAHDPVNQRLLVVAGARAAVDVLDVADPRRPALAYSLQLEPFGGGVQSVAVRGGLAVAAVQGADVTAPGSAVFFDVASGAVLDVVATGALPDMITFSPDGRYVLTADEGEPSPDGLVDPEGSVTVVDLAGGFPASAKRATFHAFDHALPAGVRIGQPGVPPSRDLEPEYIAVSADTRTAWVTLQENNAIAEVDVRDARVVALRPLGRKDHGRWLTGLDPSDADAGIRIGPQPVSGLYMPDGVATYSSFLWGTLLVTANEGDARDRDDWSDEARVGDEAISLDPAAFPDAGELRADGALGRLKIVATEGDTDGDGDLDELISFGARSFSIWDRAGNRLFDSGDLLERLVAARHPDAFNASNDSNQLDGRSDDKGPEPEAVVVARPFGRPLAFVALERTGSIAVFDVTFPLLPALVGYVDTRDYGVEPGEGDAGDLAPEGLTVIAAADSPTGAPLLAVAYEVSGTVRIFELAAP